MKIREIQDQDNPFIKQLIQENLQAVGLDIPGTAYYDPMLDSLSEYYRKSPKASYYVLLDEEEELIGGVGFEEFPNFDQCAELQKLYLADSWKRQGFGSKLLSFIEERAKEAGFQQMYLETHMNLKPAIILYEKFSYQEINRPDGVIHTSMNRFYLKDL